MKWFWFILLIVHGLIHTMAFVFTRVQSKGETKPSMTRLEYWLWISVGLIFITAALIYIGDLGNYWIAAGIAILSSQFLILQNWKAAKFGTALNVLILFLVLTGFFEWRFYSRYKADLVSERRTQPKSIGLLEEKDLQHLPDPVKLYLKISGCLGKPKVGDFKVIFSGEIRKDEDSEWMPFTSEQYNFMGKPARLFFMKAKMMGLPVSGYHASRDGKASMDIRLFSVFQVQYMAGPMMDTAETVTFFNDMCVMAPATLIDKRIEWLEAKGHEVKAAFNNEGIRIQATLYFNNKGELVNFISPDRYAAGADKKLPWSTPIENYRTIQNHRLAGKARAIYAYPSGDLCYGTFNLEAVEYNVTR